MNTTEFSKYLDTTYQRLQLGLQNNLRNYDWRITQLKALEKLIIENDKALTAAMWKDLRKSHFECSATEQGIVLAEIKSALKNLKKWMRPEKVSTPIYNQIGHSCIVNEPLGLTLIIGAWNYPVNLLLAPLVGAIAGGNAVILKPSEVAVQTSKVIAELIPRYMDQNLIIVIEGGVEETGVLLNKKFDKIFFTGSGQVGKIVLAKAAPHLTPVTLELGGKSPAIVLADANLAISARRIMWGKFMNAGQTCIAPDYLILHPSIKEKFLSEAKKSLLEFYGSNPETNPDYCRIINERNFDRLQLLFDKKDCLHGGQFKRDELFISPTIVNSTSDSAIMQEEIFGPILPILEIDNIDQIIQFVNERPKPLALYLFTKDKNSIDKIISRTSSGAVCINEVVMHLPEESLPFGGVGPSGMGNYHGRFSFKTFTHAKGVLEKSFWPELSLRYPPYSVVKEKWLKWLFK